MTDGDLDLKLAQAAKERYLASMLTPAGRRTGELAAERGRLKAELKELKEAQSAAADATNALDAVAKILGSASSWSTYDTFFGGGAIASSIKHSRLDDAANASTFADYCLARLRTELADVGGSDTLQPVQVNHTTQFIDVWFDNIFTDMSVRDQINDGQHNVAQAQAKVRQIEASLTLRTSQATARLAAVETERLQLLGL